MTSPTNEESEVERVVMLFFKAKDVLPNDGEYVLIHVTKTNWGDTSGKQYWKVARFVRGISEEDRAKMKGGEIQDDIEIGWICPTPPGDWIKRESKRSSIYKQGDVHGNNLVPYAWDAFGPGSYFGQEVDIWARIPDLGA